MKKEELTSLLIKVYLGEANQSETDELHRWRELSAGNEALYQRIMSGVSVSEMQARYARYDHQKVMQAIRRKIAKRERRRRLVFSFSAASVVLLISLASALYLNSRDQQAEQTKIAIAKICPGEPKAVLTLGDGRQVALTKMSGPTIICTGVKIADEQATLNYSQQIPLAKILDRKPEIEWHTVEVPTGGEFSVILSDGTKVWINSESSLTYPVVFTGALREIKLKGEAYFEVAHNSAEPFVVDTEVGVKIHVTGTQFCVESRANKSDVRTTLVEGCVEVTAGSKQVCLQPNQQAVYQREQSIMVVRDVDAREITAWQRGLFIFTETPLADIMNTLKRWYDIDVEYKDNEVRCLCFTGDLSKYDSFETVVKMFTDTRRLSLEVVGDKLIVGRK